MRAGSVSQATPVATDAALAQAAVPDGAPLFADALVAAGGVPDEPSQAEGPETGDCEGGVDVGNASIVPAWSLNLRPVGGSFAAADFCDTEGSLPEGGSSTAPMEGSVEATSVSSVPPIASQGEWPVAPSSMGDNLSADAERPAANLGLAPAPVDVVTLDAIATGRAAPEAAAPVTPYGAEPHDERPLGEPSTPESRAEFFGRGSLATTAAPKLSSSPATAGAPGPPQAGAAATPTAPPGASVAESAPPVAQAGGVPVPASAPEGPGGGVEIVRQRTQEAQQTAVRPEDVVTAAGHGLAFRQDGAAGRESRDGADSDDKSGAHPEIVRRLALRPAAQNLAGMLLMQGADRTPSLASSIGGPLPTFEPSPHHAGNVDRMVQTMRVMLKDGVSEATVRLHPEHLGDVRIDIRVQGKSVVATVHAESAVVREWLQLHEDALRSGLSQQGLTLDRLVVQRDARRERRDQPAEDFRRARTRREPGPQARFDVSA